jgi:transketolase
MEDLGINSRICQYTQEVSSTVTARKNAKQEAEETVNTRLDKRSQLIKERIQDLEEKHNHNLHRWTTMQLDDLAQDTDDLASN